AGAGLKRYRDLRGPAGVGALWARLLSGSHESRYALIGVGVAFLSAGLLADWEQRQEWRRQLHATQEAPEENAAPEDMDAPQGWWDRAYITGAHDLRLALRPIPSGSPSAS